MKLDADLAGRIVAMVTGEHQEGPVRKEGHWYVVPTPRADYGVYYHGRKRVELVDPIQEISRYYAISDFALPEQPSRLQKTAYRLRKSRK